MEQFKQTQSAGTQLEQQRKVFDHYVRELRLSEEDLQKQILDVGSEFGEFANEAKRRGYNGVVSLDADHPDDADGNFEKPKEFGAGKFVVADSRSIPFATNQFDLVVSVYSMPHVLGGRTKRIFKKRVEKAVSEMIRVTKVGGEVRFGGVPLLDGANRVYDRGEQLRRVLKKIDSSLEVSEEGESVNQYSDEKNQLHEVRDGLIRIRKLADISV